MRGVKAYHGVIVGWVTGGPSLGIGHRIVFKYVLAFSSDKRIPTTASDKRIVAIMSDQDIDAVAALEGVVVLITLYVRKIVGADLAGGEVDALGRKLNSRQIAPGLAIPSNRAAMFTPAPMRSPSLSSTTSPR
jgi:hypothetical protein